MNKLNVAAKKEKQKCNQTKRDYKAAALVPIVIFIGLYMGCGCIFTMMGKEHPFAMMSRYTAILISVIIAMMFFEPHEKFNKKFDIYCQNAGRSGVMLLGLVVLMAGGFSGAARMIGGEQSIVNIGVRFIPIHFMIPGIFVVCAMISTCIGTSMGTLVTMLPIASSLALGAGLNLGMTGAAVITGAFFGDNLSMISDTTICATKGVGAQMKDKFRVNFYLAFPAAVITVLMYAFLSPHVAVETLEAGAYHIDAIFPYFIVLMLAIKGMNVVIVLAIGMLSCCLIGILNGSITIFDWAKAVSDGMQGMFWLAVFTTMVSGLIGMVEYYGGISYLVTKISKKIKNRKQCESMIGVLSMLVSGVIVNNTMAIIIMAPVAKELGEKYKIEPKKMASLLDIGACLAVMLAPHGSAVMMVAEATKSSYLEILKYEFYPLLLILITTLAIWMKRENRKES